MPDVENPANIPFSGEIRFFMLSWPGSALAFVGRHASIAFACSILLGLALPAFAAVLKPAIPASIFTFIILSFARASIAGVKRVLANRRQLAIALALSTILPPIIGVVTILALGGAQMDPALRLAIALMAAAPPLMASPAFVALAGFENSLALTLLVLGMVVTPVSAPFLATLLAGAYVPLEPMELATRLALFIGGGMAIGLGLRHWLGVEWFTARKEPLDGVGVICFFLFAIAAMDGVPQLAMARPGTVVFWLALSFLLCMIGFAASWLATPRMPFADRFNIATGISMRNMGMLIAPLISLVPRDTFHYFALAQVPIYVAPVVLKAVRRWLEPKP